MKCSFKKKCWKVYWFFAIQMSYFWRFRVGDWGSCMPILGYYILGLSCDCHLLFLLIWEGFQRKKNKVKLMDWRISEILLCQSNNVIFSNKILMLWLYWSKVPCESLLRSLCFAQTFPPSLLPNKFSHKMHWKNLVAYSMVNNEF